MKTLFNPASTRRCFGLFALVCCLFINRAQSQYIPIDTVFGKMLRTQHLDACLLGNDKLDTICAKQMTFSNMELNICCNELYALRSLEGIQYIGKNMEGLPIPISRGFSIGAGDADGLKTIPDLPNIYSKVSIGDLDSLQALPVLGSRLKDFECGFMPLINAIPALPDSVERISIRWMYGLQTIMQPLPSRLNTLICNFNPLLTTLPPLPATLIELTAIQCSVNTLPALPPQLDVLNVAENNISVIPSLPSTLTILLFRDNNVSVIPPLPSTLKLLNCAQNQIAALPPIEHTNLETIDCSHNQISTLANIGLNTLRSIDCSHNQLQVLPSLPDFLRVVRAADNMIDSITNLPLKLSGLIISNNNLSGIPVLPDSTILLYASNNHISQLPAFPQVMTHLSIDTNPIACLPPMPPQLQVISISHTNITCFPNQPHWNVAPLPLCVGEEECQYAGLSGQVYFDKNSNCVFDNGDVAVPNRLVAVDSTHYTMTDENGWYRLIVPAGNYTVHLPAVNYTFGFNCDSTHQINYNGTDTIDNLHFAITVPDCAALFVDVSASLIRVAVPNTHKVLVQNQGFATTANVEVKVKFEPELIPLSSIPAWNQQIGNTLIYNIDSLGPFEDLIITIIDSASINSLPGQTACVMASIKGSNTCALDTSALWDASHLEVQSDWETGEDSISFFIKNLGSTMGGSTEYRIYEEELLMFRGDVQLNALDSVIIKVLANGNTYRVEVDQRPFFPGLSAPREFVELAGTPPYSLHKILPIPQDDADEWVEIDCHEIVTSYDPNEKSVSPAGVGEQHYITANDELEYLLRFQNTGTDTAFLVRLVDALDVTKLDIETFRSGVSSHPYTVNMQGNGVITWRFANILLPDSHTNEPLSNGFVKFSIRQRAGNQPGNVINNFVDIYFDYNTPIRTNTAFVTIEEKDRIFSAIVEPRNIDNGYTINIMPNPFAEQAQFTITNKYGSDHNYTFELFDITGRSLARKQVQSNFTIYRDEMVAGVYLFKITNNGKAVGNGKIMVK